MNETILIAEDEDRMRIIIKEYLEDEHYNVLEAINGEEAMACFINNKIDLVLLDIMMPEIDGWSVCRKIRKTSDVPIVMITARSEEDDKLMGYELGADDYITKPFSTKVLIAKINSLIKRYKGAVLNRDDVISAGSLSIDRKAYQAHIDSKPLELTTREYEILLYLVSNKGHVLSRDQMLNEIWGYDYYGNERIVDAHIKKLRKKLGDLGVNIKTVLRIGYKYDDEGK